MCKHYLNQQFLMLIFWQIRQERFQIVEKHQLQKQFHLFQLLKFYIKSRKKKILVKKLLGFKNNDIFKEIYTRNLKNTLISVAISILILVFIKKASLKIVFIPFIFLSLDFLITFISIKTINLSSVYSLLKGESYD